jgi:Fic/DOC family
MVSCSSYGVRRIPMTLAREIIRPVAYSDLPRRLRSDLEAASADLAGLVEMPVDRLRKAPQDRFEVVTHRLSLVFKEIHAGSRLEERSEIEGDALNSFASGQMQALTRDGFLKSLGALNSSLTGGRSEWRRDDIFMAPDGLGVSIRLPQARHIPKQMEQVRGFLVRDSHSPALWNATVVLALIVNCHPFTDGNGRVARVLFNYVLRRGGMPDDVYFPFYEIARRSCGGYEIALRCAELRGDWCPLMQFVLSAIECYRALATEA